MHTEKNHFELLQQLLSSVNMWLHFAEAKNAALIAFNIALLSALFNADLFVFSSTIFSSIIIGLLISIVVLLFSFLPKNSPLKKIIRSNIEANLFHYVYVATLDSEEFLSLLYKRYWAENNQNTPLFSRIERDCSKEIIQNARIAVRKQLFFNIAFKIDVVIIIIAALLIICA